MNINNIAIVRATNIIPFDGVVKSISNSHYIDKNTRTLFAAEMSKLLEKLEIKPSFDFSKMVDEEYVKKFTKESAKILSDYIPYTSDYNSMVLFSLNGICPDDGTKNAFANNTFSNKKCAIIAPLAEYIDNVVSLVPTDTAIKGDVCLSNTAIILLNEEVYNNLTKLEQEKLSNLKCTLKLFNGSLKDAIDRELKLSGIYIKEDLSLSREDDGFIKSPTSELQKETIRKIALEKEIAQVRFRDILTHNNHEQDKLETVKDENDNSVFIQDYYLSEFLNYLFICMKVDEKYFKMIPDLLHIPSFFEKICGMIADFGIDNYKKILDTYNLKLENDRKSGSLLTPEEIIQKYKLSKSLK